MTRGRAQWCCEAHQQRPCATPFRPVQRLTCNRSLPQLHSLGVARLGFHIDVAGDDEHRDAAVQRNADDEAALDLAAKRNGTHQPLRAHMGPDGFGLVAAGVRVLHGQARYGKAEAGSELRAHCDPSGAGWSSLDKHHGRWIAYALP